MKCPRVPESTSDEKGSPRTEELVRQAQDKLEGSDLPPSRELRRYAALLAAAEVYTLVQEAQANTNFRNAQEWASKQYGIDGRADPDQARAAHNTARQIMQQMREKVKAAGRMLNEARALYRQHENELPAQLKTGFPLKLIDELQLGLSAGARWLDVPRSARLPDTVQTIGLTLAQACFLWWHYYSRGRREWSQMHRLARVWRLTDAQDVESFRRIVLRLRQQHRMPGIAQPYLAAEDQKFFE